MFQTPNAERQCGTLDALQQQPITDINLKQIINQQQCKSELPTVLKITSKLYYMTYSLLSCKVTRFEITFFAFIFELFKLCK